MKKSFIVILFIVLSFNNIKLLAQCPSIPSTVNINEIGTLLTTPPTQAITARVIVGYPLLEVDDINHTSWSNIQTVGPSTNIDYMTSGSIGFVDIELKNPGNSSLCWDTVTIQIVGPLPVEWLKPLTCQKIKNNVEVFFATAHQVNNSHFEIERSADGREFYKIGEIEGEGTTISENYYSFTDDKPSNGINYYRIKQIDFDGKFEYSNIASVSLMSDSPLQVYPNPANNFITIMTKGEQEVKIIDGFGELKMSATISHSGQLDISELPVGVYLLVARDLSQHHYESKYILKY